jgi:hypothetical protein
MTCAIDCQNDGVCSFNDTCVCPPCFIGRKCETSVNVIKFSMTFAIHWDIREVTTDSKFNAPEFIYTTVIALMLLMAIINNVACLQTFFLPDIRLTNCGVFQIFYSIIGLITIIGLELRMLTMLVFDSLTQAYSYRYIACNLLPVLVIAFGDVCMWLSALLVIEFILLECFDLSIYRSRRFSVLSTIICIILTSGSHLHELIGRRPSPDPDQPNSYTCKYMYSSTVDTIDKVLRAIHVIIPCTIHFTASIWMLISMSRRTMRVRDRHDFCRIFGAACIKRKHFFVPPLFIILSNLPHLILHLKDTCEDARDISLLRLHVAFNILVYLPPSVTFFIYIYPSESYMHRFKKTCIGRWLKRIFQKVKNELINIWHINSNTTSHETLTSTVMNSPSAPRASTTFS